MSEFIITEDQANFILNVLAEYPAKHTLGAIDILRTGLKLHREHVVEALPVVTE